MLKKESSNSESQSIKIVETNSRTPHGKYAAYSKASGMLRIEAWNEFKQLAVKCNQINEPVDLVIGLFMKVMRFWYSIGF